MHQSLNFAKSFKGHDPRLLEQLPLDMQAEFPAHMSHRRAISKSVGNLLRPDVQNALGLKRFARVLEELHHLRHDSLELQYYNATLNKKRNSQLTLFDLQNSRSQYSPFSAFNDRQGYAGFGPSAAYVRPMCRAIIDEMRPLMDKQVSLLDGKILKGDHSFKIIKHMGKTDGSPAFNALYTICNEYEEIRIQVLAPTKALSHLKPSFDAM